ncbi:MAG: class I SAM-dependent methyltransferase [Roseomonas sp.]|nr:class I SAM-dependent methyltransferase [Roseomonas sp.]MCA3382993.1 class I SAM-dependent methyltransferase [Roseomonas sp.]
MSVNEKDSLNGPDQQIAARLSAYFSSDKEKIRGFLTDGAAAVITTTLRLQAEQDIRGNIAEIGTYHGKTFVGLALALRDDERIVGVDIFDERGNDFESNLRENYRSFGVPDIKVQLHRGPSTALSVHQWRELLQGPARFVHVDGEHTRKAAYQDLNLAVSAMAPGGAILVDDVLHPWFPDVTLGLLDFLSHEQDIVAVALIDRQGPLMKGGPKMLLSRRADLARYRRCLLEQMRRNIVSEAQFDRHRPLVLSFDNGVVSNSRA